MKLEIKFTEGSTTVEALFDLLPEDFALSVDDFTNKFLVPLTYRAMDQFKYLIKP